ncbi:MAG: inorganic phosphate transporter [Oculatellaceae cyanobacterium Prado106]|nr:inorganic phosphate transporter [Oculatellaceae cyanobacterium Prado106]
MTHFFFLLLFAATLFLAYSNGANDNFKGVATLFGSRTTSYKVAIAWATLTTIAGSLFSVFLASALIKSFSGKGLVPDAIADGTDFHLAVALAAGLTVILATVLGFPISTTHGLTGALVGAGWVAMRTTAAVNDQVNWSVLGKTFLLPLILSPLIVIPCGALLYSLARSLRSSLGVQKEMCLCVGKTVTPLNAGSLQLVGNSLTGGTVTDVAIAPVEQCKERYVGQFWGMNSQSVVDAIHFLSAGLVGFARGLNDTPKIVSLMLVGEAFSVQGGAIAVAVAMAIGGWLNARKVAETMSQKIATIAPGQGLIANGLTAAMVIAASRFGLPVSTTHVSVGSIFGVGLTAGTANARMFLQILLSWVLTLPIAALLSALFYQGFHR